MPFDIGIYDNTIALLRQANKAMIKQRTPPKLQHGFVLPHSTRLSTRQNDAKR
jgi:hypothetical protein